MLAFSFPNLILPIQQVMLIVLNGIHHVIPSYGLTMIALAFVVRLALWPLANQQFKSMAEMQKVQPLLKQLQARNKGNPQQLQVETMALYKEHGVNPLAGCLPMVIQLPLLLGLFYAINSQLSHFKTEHFLWIGSALSEQFPKIFATSLATLDVPLFVLYIVSMYLSVRYGSPPSTDPQQAQTQKIMAFVSPAMIAWFGFKYQWASALLIYWLALNCFTMAQQLWMFRRYGLVGGAKAVPAPGPVPLPATNGKVLTGRQTPVSKNGSSSGRSRRRSKR